MNLGASILYLLGELVAPTRCCACDELVRPRLLFCTVCGVSVLPASVQPEGHYAVFSYGGAVASAIMRLKYAGRSDLAPRLGVVMVRAVEEIRSSVDVVVPVPLHASRLATRGFDQAALLGSAVARALRRDHAARALVRIRRTPPQASLDRASRASNVAEAFRCRSARIIEGKRVLLVDDVRTTGSTLASCAETLKRSGARRVSALVLASRDRDVEPRGERGDDD